ncbi:hypothetical protein ABTZ21_12620 [Streptomyces sp. NPDC096191]|uniref:response regulator transcription factor n=1 Tax=Streptomyces sp. NPDC096191 TaxID=3155426 RepID=UPI00332FBED4
MTTVLLLDDQSLQRLGLLMFIEAQPDLTVVGEAGDGAEVARQMAQLRPGEEGLRAHGVFGEQAHTFDPQVWASRHHVGKAVAAAGFALLRRRGGH